MVERDLHAYLDFVAASNGGGDVEAARSVTIEVPLDIARAAVAVGELAESLAEHGNPNLWADAVVAAILSSAAAGSAALLVAVNLGDAADDKRLESARSLAEAATVRAGRLSSPPQRDARGRGPKRLPGNRRR